MEPLIGDDAAGASACDLEGWILIGGGGGVGRQQLRCFKDLFYYWGKGRREEAVRGVNGF